MEAFIIEQAGQIKEAFSYNERSTVGPFAAGPNIIFAQEAPPAARKRPPIEATRHALEEYARATYGYDAIIRPMTRKEEADFIRFGSEFFRKDLTNGKRCVK